MQILYLSEIVVLLKVSYLTDVKLSIVPLSIREYKPSKARWQSPRFDSAHATDIFQGIVGSRVSYRCTSISHIVNFMLTLLREYRFL